MTARTTSLAAAVWDIGTAVGAYYGLRLAGASERTALLVAGVLAATRLVWVAVRRRRVTWFAATMLAVFGLGLLLTFLSGDARFLLLKDSIVTAGVGIVFLLSAAAGRPLTLSAAQTTQPWWADELEEMFRRDAGVRRRMVVSAVVWGIALLAESAARVPLIHALPVDVMVAVSEVLFWGTLATVAAWNLFYTRAVWQTLTAPRPSAIDSCQS